MSKEKLLEAQRAIDTLRKLGIGSPTVLNRLQETVNKQAR
jgi:hypothetical protein